MAQSGNAFISPVLFYNMLKFKDIVKIDTKGRVVVPQTIRKELEISPSEKLDIMLTEDNMIVLVKK